MVAKGYRLSCPLPPINRIEKSERPRRATQSEVPLERRVNKHCYRLRETLEEAFTEAIRQNLVVVDKLQREGVCSTEDVRKYYEIYDISVSELEDTNACLRNAGVEPFSGYTEFDTKSLRALRVLFARAYMVRKAAFCCILAIPATGEIGESAMEAMRTIADSTGKRLAKVREVLNQDGPSMATPPMSPTVPLNGSDGNGTSDRQRSQLRRLNGLSQGIRGLHVKMNVIREETQQVSQQRQTEGPPQSPSAANSSLVTMYESIGADLRELLEEWESGRSLLLQQAGDNPNSSMPVSRSSSPTSSRFFERPQSSSSMAGSLSGTTAFSGEGEIEDREKMVFEAVSLGRRGSLMSNNGGSAHNQEIMKKRRIEKMREERKAREEGRKKSDMSRTMLRELSMVIKMRDIHGEGPSNNNDNDGRNQDAAPALSDAGPIVDSPVPIVPLPVEIEREKRDRRSV